MRTIPIALVQNAASNASTLVWGVRLTRQDGEVYGWTSHDRDITIASVLYEAGPGLDISQLVVSAGLNVDTAEVTTTGGDEVTRLDILAGRWDGASFVIFRFNWKAPTDGMVVLMIGSVGNWKPQDGVFVAELRDTRQLLQQDTGDVFQMDCPYRLGDAKCTVDLAPFTHTGEVESVANQFTFTADLAEDDDYFGEGEVEWLTGLNAGIRCKVRTYVSGVFALSLPLLFAIEIGDTFTAIAGCRKRHARSEAVPDGVSDCLDKFDNVLNFGGHPNKPTVAELAESADY